MNKVLDGYGVNNDPRLYDNLEDFNSGVEWAEKQLKDIIEDIIFYSEDDLSDGECLDKIVSELKIEFNHD